MSTLPSKFEFITEHLGFSPIEFVDDVVNAANDLMYQAVASLEQFLQSETGGSDETEQGLHQIETLLEHALDKAFDKFELYALSRIFVIPDEVVERMPHYRNLHFSYRKEEEDAIDLKLHNMRRNLMTEKAVNHRLKREYNNVDRRLKRIMDCMEKIAFISAPTPENNELLDNLTMAAKELVTLKATLESTREAAGASVLLNSSDMDTETDGTTPNLTTDIRYLYLNGIVARHIAANKSREARLSGQVPAEENSGVQQSELEQSQGYAGIIKAGGTYDFAAEYKRTIQMASVSNWQNFNCSLSKVTIPLETQMHNATMADIS